VYESEGIDLSSTGIVFHDNADIIELLCGSLAQASAAYYNVGDKVTWSRQHALVPAGTVGKILEIRSDGKRVVEFPGATYAITTSSLTAAAPPNVFAIMNNLVHADSEEAFHRDITKHLGTKLPCTASTFTVQHYFGPVEYGGEKESRFCEKNRDQTYDRFFIWWRGQSTNALAKRLRVVKNASTFSGADVTKAIIDDVVIHADLGAEILRVVRRTVPDSITSLRTYWKGRISTTLPQESNWTAKTSNGATFYRQGMFGPGGNRTQYHPPRYREDDGDETQYVPPPYVERSEEAKKQDDTLVIYVTVATMFNQNGRLPERQAGRQPKKAGATTGPVLETVSLRASLRVVCNDRGQARAADVDVADSFSHVRTSLDAKHLDQRTTETKMVERKNVTANGTQDRRAAPFAAAALAERSSLEPKKRRLYITPRKPAMMCTGAGMLWRRSFPRTYAKFGWRHGEPLRV
jgi:hypothetical protein